MIMISIHSGVISATTANVMLYLQDAPSQLHPIIFSETFVHLVAHLYLTKHVDETCPTKPLRTANDIEAPTALDV